MGKGEDTRQAILATALKMAAATGICNLTIGQLAVATNLSKSGLFAHFKSKETLQLSVLEYAAEMFRSAVISPARETGDPLEKLNLLTSNWLDWYEGSANTCIFIVAMNEFEDQSGPIHDYIVAQQRHWLEYLEHKVKDVVDSGQFKKDTDPEQFVFRLQSLYLGTELYRWLGKEDQKRKHFFQGFKELVHHQLVD